MWYCGERWMWGMSEVAADEVVPRGGYWESHCWRVAWERGAMVWGSQARMGGRVKGMRRGICG
jgi:hypothetical protein